MFKNLRRGFIRMNMLVISLLMLAAFTTVYIITYSNTQKEIGDELNMLLSMTGGGRAAPGPYWEAQLPQAGTQPQQPGPDEKMPEGENLPFANVPRIGFAVHQTDEGYELAPGRHFFNADEFDIETMLAEAEAGAEAGRFKLGEHSWSYRSTPDADGRLTVAFVETSESGAMLANLVKVFLLVAVLLLVAIWFVSRWFARRSVAPIEEAYNHQRRFVQDASHELKTPVAVIKTNLELLASHPDETVASQREWLDNIQAETAQMQRLTSDLLALARADAELPQEAPVAFSLSDTVQDCVLPLEAVLYEKQLAFSFDIEPGITATGSQSDMRRLVQILMENAIQYTPAGGQVALRLAREKQKAVLRVSNTGAPIAEADLPHLFDRFYRGDAAHARGGNNYGLGLSIAQGIVQRHGGGIAAQSQGGTTAFTVTLPAK